MTQLTQASENKHYQSMVTEFNLFSFLLQILHYQPDELDQSDDEWSKRHRSKVIAKHSPDTHQHLNNQ